MLIGLIVSLFLGLFLNYHNYLGTSFNNKDCSSYIKEEYKIENFSEMPKYRNYLWYSPKDNSTLKRIVIIPEDKYTTDSRSRSILYSDTNNLFWLSDNKGLSGGTWYGPFTGTSC